MTIPAPTHALSIKQPWAALLVHGLKSIEIRTWPTRRRGPLFIHTGKVPDPRAEAWQWITTPELQQSAALLGGVIGVAELVDCVHYSTQVEFAADRDRHLNEPEWFRTKGLYGFMFRNSRVLDFVPVTGNTFFFPVSGIQLE